MRNFKRKSKKIQTLTNLKLPQKFACDFLELNKKLSHKSDGDTIAWLMKQAETDVQAAIHEESRKQEQSVRLPDECALEFFKLTKRLGYRAADGDTIVWLLKQVKPAVQAVMSEHHQEEQQTKEKAQQLTKREFTAKFGKCPRVCIPSECAFDFFQLNEKLGHKFHGDTIAWLLLKQAELAVQDTNINEEDVKNEEIERKDLEQVWEKYEVNQVWALWDDGVDGMPRVYVRIEKLLLEELKVEVVFLEANAGRDEEKKWLREKELPMACGRFKIGTSTSIVEILDFSYQVNLERGELSKISKLYVAKGETWVNIFPRDGEIWAVYKDWSANWTFHDLSRARYELVEVVSELPSSESEMTVICLTRVETSGVVFERGYHKGEIKWRQYSAKQLLQFSHRIPASKLKIEEMKGVPNEAWKLNPAAVPLHLV